MKPDRRQTADFDVEKNEARANFFAKSNCTFLYFMVYFTRQVFQDRHVQREREVFAWRRIHVICMK